MSKKIILTETELVNLVKKIINEQPVKVTSDGLVIISGNKYRLQKKGLDVDVDSIRPQKDGSFEVRASLGIISQQDTLPKIEVDRIIKLADEGAKIIPIPNREGKIDKKLIKIER